MKRFTHRTIGICIGLTLGWYVAGVVQNPGGNWGPADTGVTGETGGSGGSGGLFIPWDSVAYAQSNDHQPHPDTHHTEAPVDPDGHGGHQSAPGHGDDLGLQSARMLVPKPHQIGWYCSVLIAAGGLFIAAVALGIPGLAMRGPEPPDPADDHAHDDHTHDGHPHEAHDGHTGH